MKNCSRCFKDVCFFQIISGVYVGNFRDSKEREQLTKNEITHILSIHDNAKPLLEVNIILHNE